MAYKFIFNPISSNFDLVVDGTIIAFKAGVANAAALPGSGNTSGDARITADNGHLYVWNGASWADQGDVIDVDWAALTNKPSSSVADIDSAVSLKHTQNSDTDLDATFEATFVKKTDTANVLSDITSAGVDIEDAVSKKHTQGTDQGLDTGGANAVTAAQAKTAYTHSGLVSGNPHSVALSDISVELNGWINSVILGTDGKVSFETNVGLQFRDSAITIASADDGHLDLTADISIDLNSIQIEQSVSSSGGYNITRSVNNIRASHSFTPAGSLSSDNPLWHFGLQANTSDFMIWMWDGTFQRDFFKIEDDGDIIIGGGVAGRDYSLTFNGETNDGIITWMEDEDYFQFADSILMETTEPIYFRDTALSISSKDDGHLDIDADTSIDLNGAVVTSAEVTVGGDGQSTFTKGLIVNNGGTGAGTDEDFIVKSLSNDDAIVVDASEDTVSIKGDTITLTGSVNIVGSLDLISQGTWTPTLIIGAGNPTAYALQEGTYSRLGNVVTCVGYIALTTLGAASGTVSIGGLPFPNDASAPSKNTGLISAESINVTAGQVPIMYIPQDGQIAYLQLVTYTSPTSLANMTEANLTDATVIAVQFSYITDAA